MNSSGILCKRMDDEGYYGDKQLRACGNGIYMTEDAWKTVSMALGEINFNGETKYGIIAQKLIGKTISSAQLIV